jgi:peptidoglycan/LPS O-acetylase OafA/YrhL
VTVNFPEPALKAQAAPEAPASSQAGGKGRGGALDALRFAASGFIVLYHFQDKAPVAFSSLHPGLDRAYLATNFFLILSGYVLARAYGARLNDGRLTAPGFLLRRVTRVWPAHALVLLAMVAVVLAAQAAGLALTTGAFSWRELPGHLLLVQAWGLGFQQGWNFPTWSLSVLVLCYAACPYLWAAVSRLGPRTALVVGVGLVLAADLAVRATGENFYAFPQTFGVVRGLPLFVLGLCLARFGSPPSLTAARAGLLWISAGLLVLGLQFVGRWDFLSILLIAVVITAAGAAVPRRPSSLVERAAELSFALYITHGLVGMIWFRALELAFGDGLADPVRWALWASGFPVALAAAFAFHHVVDLPLQRWIKPRLPGLNAAPPARPAPADVARIAP